MRLVAIGLLAGALSGLFGVGGGIVIVPLLVLWLAYDERVAAATSLAAIGVVALAGVAVYALAGRVHVGEAALVGLPAAIGATFGAALQQRLANRTLALAFAAFLVAVAIRLLV